MTPLFVLNDPPYGTERSYNGLRLVGDLAKRQGEEVKVFLMGDGAACAKSGQKVPQGYYNLGRMIQVVAQHGGGCGGLRQLHGCARRAGRRPGGGCPARHDGAAGRLDPMGNAGAGFLARSPCRARLH